MCVSHLPLFAIDLTHYREKILVQATPTFGMKFCYSRLTPHFSIVVLSSLLKINSLV